MPTEKHYEEIFRAFQSEMQEYINEGFRANDCFPFVFANLIETTGITGPDRTELHQQLMDWTRKIL
jgi:hypothetical protein